MSTTTARFLFTLTTTLSLFVVCFVSGEDQVCSSMDGTSCNEGGRDGRGRSSYMKGELRDIENDGFYKNHDEYNTMMNEDDDEDDEEFPERDLYGCEDTHEQCAHWASIGECEVNPNYMLTGCPFSCGQCDIDVYMGIEQILEDKKQPKIREEISKVLDKSRTYLKEKVLKDKKLKRSIHLCYNKFENCAFWAAIGECDVNPTFMKSHCGPVCQSCDYSLIETRCPVLTDGSMPNAWESGDLNEFFTNITTLEEYKKYEPIILSKPKEEEAPLEKDKLIQYQNAEEKPEEYNPWVVTLEKFLTAEECDHLIQLGYFEGYERSADVGAMRPDGTYGDNVNDGRTSENAWCQDQCYRDPIAKRVIDRIANVTGIPEPNSEYLQLLKYEVGQFYQTHHDYIDHLFDRQPGPRMLTVFLYLNDVEEGGGTNFPDLDLTVEPKKGRALIWPSVLSDDPNEKEVWTEHQALPVIKGQKFGANAWLHLRDFKKPNRNNCH